MTDGLSYDADGNPIGDRVVSSGWQIPWKVRLFRADDSGRVNFPGISYNGQPGVKAKLIINGQEIVGEPVVLDDDYLVSERPFGRTVRPHRAVLDDFLRLVTDPSDGAILAYARRYGLLGLATSERRERRWAVDSSSWTGELAAPAIGYRHSPAAIREPMKLWRRIIREVAAVYSIAGHLRQDKTVAITAWDPLTGVIILPLPYTETDEEPQPAPLPVDDAGTLIWVGPDALDGQRQALAAILGTWLALGVVRPVIDWGNAGNDDPVINLGVKSLFGGLVLELLLAVAGQPGFAMCSGCGLPYTPHRRPPSGSYGAARKTYCPTCRESNGGRKTPRPQLDAAARWRAKNPDYYGGRRREARPHDQGAR
jgi:hypothetical protein